MRYVAGLMFSENLDKIVMILKNRPEWQAGLFNVVGGKIENQEDPATAMVRECLEETGVKTVEHDWHFFTSINGSWGTVTFFTIQSDRILEARTIEDEEIHIMDSKALPENIVQNLRWIVPMAMDQDLIPPILIKYV